MNSLYSAVGISKQAVHKHKQGETLFCTRLDALIIEADVLRGEHPGCGVEKMYYTLKPNWLGRDRFIEVMKELGYK
jgi:putative transposase